MAGGGQLNLPQHLSPCTAAHDPRLDDLTRDPLDAEDRHPGHWRDGVGDRGDDTRLVREADEHADRDEEGEVREGLGQVHDRDQELFDPTSLGSHQADEASEQGGDRNGHQDRGQRDHRLVPAGLRSDPLRRFTNEGGVENESDRQEGEAPATQLPTDDTEEAGDHDPRQGGNMPRLVEAHHGHPAQQQGRYG